MTIQTPFEVTGQITNLTVESSFLSNLVADSGRVAVYQVGTSQGGNPLLVVGVGTTPPPLPTTADPGAFLGSFAQHARNEPASHEAGLAFVRDLAYTTDPDLLAHMADHPFWVVPNWNPDRATATGTWPDNSWFLNGINPNRDHVALSCPETQAFYDFLTVLRPAVVVDVHENNAFATHNVEIGVGTVDSPQIDAQLDIDLDALAGAILGDLTSEGLSAGIYVDGGEMDGDERMLTSATPLRSTATVLIESKSDVVSITQRLAWLKTGLDIIMARFLSDDVAAMTAGARTRTAAKAGAGDLTWEAAPGVIVTAGGYTLPSNSSAKTYLDRQGIDWTEDGGTLTVSLADQPSAFMAVAALDPSASHTVLTATRLATVPGDPDPPTESGLLRTNGDPVTLARTDGSPVTLT